MIKNAKTLPKVFYGLHMVEGVAEYREHGSEPYRIMIGEEAIKNMDPSFAGKPVYVMHVDEVSVEKIQEEADGYVIESFFNQADGKHWVKFIVVSDRGHEAIRSGWKLSNSYTPKELSTGGLWHGVEYANEVKRGEYDHLAIVPNPRYGESEILTPEDFKSYNLKKELELKRLSNDKGDSSMFKIFKKTKVENSAEFESMVVTLPKSGKEMTITQLVNEADELEKKKEAPQMANGDHKVKVGNEEMTVNELVEKHLAMKDSMKKNEEMDGDEQNAIDADGDADEKKKNEEEIAEQKKNEELENKKKNEEKVIAEKKKSNATFEALKNAPNTVIRDTPVLELSSDKVARGKSRYGS